LSAAAISGVTPGASAASTGDVTSSDRSQSRKPPTVRGAIGANALWLQQGIVSAEAREIALAGGLDYVEDHCIAVERAIRALTKL
jgi:hypothetical protein